MKKIERERIIYKNIYKKMDLLEDFKKSPSNFCFVRIHIIHKLLVLLKNHLNY